MYTIGEMPIHYRRSIGVLFLMVASIGLYVSMRADVMYAEAETIGQNVGTFKELSDRFESLAKDKGGVYAYEVLRRAQLPPNTDIHLLGHTVGDVLYTQVGLDGIADCTQDFRNACSHTIVIGALNEFGGEAALPMIRDACTKAPGGSGAYTMCYHGLGHGVFAFYGYSLPETVEFCRKTGTEKYHNREYIECVGGAIMELMGGGGHDRDAWLVARKNYLSTTDPLSPCTRSVIPEDAKGMCLTYATPNLWEVAGINLGAPEPEKFFTAFSYCEVLPDSGDLKDICYGGFGKEFFPLAASRDTRDGVRYTKAQLSQVITWCEYAGETRGIGACIGEAVASAFWGGEKDPENAFGLCVAADDFQKECYERLAREIQTYTRGTQRATLCARLPDDAQTLCGSS